MKIHMVPPFSDNCICFILSTVGAFFLLPAFQFTLFISDPYIFFINIYKAAYLEYNQENEERNIYKQGYNASQYSQYVSILTDKKSFNYEKKKASADSFSLAKECHFLEEI